MTIATLQRRILPAIAFALGLVGIARPCCATPNFPAVVQQFVSSAEPPPCTICHNNPNGGLGTVTTAFGEYMISRGLIPNDTTSLRNALSAAEGEMHDSNGDGVSDIDALREGLDPNGSGGDPPPPGFGCGLSTRVREAPNGAWVFLLLIGGYLTRRARIR
jgi:hypothetical protein